MAPAPKRPSVEYADLLGGAVRGGAGELLRVADEIERAHTQEEAKRLEIEERLQAGHRDRPVVAVHEWIRNPYFVGGLASDEPGGLWPVLKDEVEDIFDGRGGLGYPEVVVGGGVGWGKTSGLMKAVYLRVLYELSCLSVPQAAFRAVQTHDTIVLVNYNVTEQKARDTLYMSVRRTLESIDYFKDVGFLPEPQTLKEMRLPKRIVVRPGVANATGAVSENLLFAVLDEANKYVLVQDSERARARGDVFDVADILHGACFNRQRSRFVLPGGEMPRLCKLISGSSAEYPEDFIERRCEEVDSGKVTHPVKVVRFSEWGTKPRSFYVMGWTPIAVSPEGGVEVLDAAAAGARRVDLEARGHAVHEVPNEHLPSFREHPELSVRELLGLATKAISPFIRRRETVDAAFALRAEACRTMGLAPELARHPFTAVETNLRDGARFLREVLAGQEGGEWRPVVSPGAVRFAHIDLSANRCGTGFCVGHVLDVREVARIRRDDSGAGAAEEVREPAPWVWVDVYLRIVAPKDENVDIAACHSLIYEMSAMGFRFGMVTFDQWESGSSRQELEKRNYPVGLVSLDRDPGPYINLRRALYEGRLLGYEYEPLREELHTVEDVRGKVVPARGQFKDVADALAAVVHHCETIGMRGRQWASADARMVLAPVSRSALPASQAERAVEAARAALVLGGATAAEAAALGTVGYGGMRDSGDSDVERPRRSAPNLFTKSYGRDGHRRLR